MLWLVDPLQRQVTWLLVVASINLTPEAQICYEPDGTLDDSNMVPCDAGRHSMCCEVISSSPDFCCPDELCQDANKDQEVWRQSCTDPTWQAPECLKLCIGISK
jgi:hypothetical protein